MQFLHFVRFIIPEDIEACPVPCWRPSRRTSPAIASTPARLRRSRGPDKDRENSEFKSGDVRSFASIQLMAKGLRAAQRSFANFRFDNPSTRSLHGRRSARSRPRARPFFDAPTVAAELSGNRRRQFRVEKPNSRRVKRVSRDSSNPKRNRDDEARRSQVQDRPSNGRKHLGPSSESVQQARIRSWPTRPAAQRQGDRFRHPAERPSRRSRATTATYPNVNSINTTSKHCA
jgi:hypothetical protein